MDQKLEKNGPSHVEQFSAAGLALTRALDCSAGVRGTYGARAILRVLK